VKVLDRARVLVATCCIDDGPPQRMAPIGTSSVWHCPWNSLTVADGVHRVTVRVETIDGRQATDAIRVRTSQSGRFELPPRQPGDNANAIGAYPEKGIPGTQLGPNKNGRKWPPRAGAKP
jgi:Icc protein